MLNNLGTHDRPLRLVLARVQRRLGLKQQHFRLTVGDRFVLDATGHNKKLAFGKSDGFISQLDLNASLMDEKQLIRLIMPVPDKFALQLGQFDLIWLPKLISQPEQSSHKESKQSQKRPPL